jgi:type I restriction enzyme, S subunit
MQERALQEGWEWVDLKKFVFFQEGPGIRKWQFKKTGIKLLNVGNIVNGALKLDKTERHVDGEEVAQKYCHFLLEPDDIVMASSGVTWGKTSVISKDHLPLMLNTSTIRLRSLDERKLDRSYLQIFINSRLFKNQIDKLITGSAQPNFGSSHLKQVKLLLPTLFIQRQIVALLNQAEVVKRRRQEADALSGVLLQSVFYEMFGDPVQNEMGWERKTLADVCVKFEHGLYVPKERYVEDNGIEMIHMADAFYGEVKPGNLRQISATDKESKKYQLLENDLLVARRSLTFEGAAKACKLPKKFGKLLFESSLIRVRPDETCIDPEYLYQYLNNQTVRRKYVFPFVTSSTISGINQENLKKITILLPPLAFQQQFTRVVQEVERIREQQTESKREINMLFDGLVTGVFNGSFTFPPPSTN